MGAYYGNLGCRWIREVMCFNRRLIDYDNLIKVGKGYWFDETPSNMLILRCHNVLALILEIFEMKYYYIL